MASIRDENGYNQGFRDSLSTRVRYERRCDYMLSKMNASADKRVLEIGCGTGAVAYMLATKSRMHVTGIDCSPPFIEAARKDYQYPNLCYEIGDFTKIEPSQEERVDYIVGNGILHHLYYQLEESLRCIHQLLNPGGRIIFLEPNLFNPYIYLIFSIQYLRRLTRLEPDEMAFSKSFIERLLVRVGFVNIQVEYRDFLIPGIPAALIKPSVVMGGVLERIPVIQQVAQSLFISADRD
jgi:2-polyprenyl-3-methyl-5-hydroxy-6-metoxy-1,4-benzoquinol methylase